MPTSFTERWSFPDAHQAQETLSRRFGPLRIYPIQPAPRVLDLTTHTFGSGALLLAGTSPSGFSLSFENRCAAYALLIGRQALMEVVFDSPGCNVHRGNALLVDIREVQTWRMQAGGGDCIVFPIDLLNRRLSRLLNRPLIRPVAFTPIDFSKVEGARQIIELARVISRVFESDSPLANVRSITRNFEDIMINFMLEVMPHNHSHLLKPRTPTIAPRHVRRALEYIHVYARQPKRIRLEDIADAANVSVRSLQTGFARAKGVSPMAYLRALRLQGVRTELTESTECRSVAEVAAAWGFPHPGVFARQYRAAFGELPSQTIKRVED